MTAPAMSEHQIAELQEWLKRLDALSKLAHANFPRTTEIRVETCGTSPQVNMHVPNYILALLLQAARAGIDRP